VDGGQLVRRPVLPAAYLRQSGDGASADSVAERERLLLMAGKLYRFMTPIGILAVALGLWLWFGFGFSPGLAARQDRAGGAADCLSRTIVVACCATSRPAATSVVTSGYRWFNEVPVLVLLAVIYLAVFKPF
jgi:putative membrane protein